MPPELDWRGLRLGDSEKIGDICLAAITTLISCSTHDQEAILEQLRD
jgi:hypothetical protein